MKLKKRYLMTTLTKKTRNSKTRNRIYEYLCDTKAHPSAYMIFNDLKPQIPSLSMGTVYNNIKYFEEKGMIINVATVNGNERYDANTSDHVHFVCDCCGAVIDIIDADINTAKSACSVKNIKINSIKIVLHGICESCTVKF